MADIIRSDQVFEGDVNMTGTGTLPNASVGNDQVKAAAAIERSKLASETVSYPIPLTSFRVWDAMQTLLPNPSANDDLGMYGGTFGTDQPLIKSYDLASQGAKNLYARAVAALPPEYTAAGAVQLRVVMALEGTTCDNSCTIDVVAYEVDKAGGVSADLCSTAAQSCNSTSYATYTFNLTATALAAGDWFDFRIHLASNDAATYASSIVAAIASVELRCAIKG